MLTRPIISIFLSHVAFNLVYRLKWVMSGLFTVRFMIGPHIHKMFPTLCEMLYWHKTCCMQRGWTNPDIYTLFHPSSLVFKFCSALPNSHLHDFCITLYFMGVEPEQTWYIKGWIGGNTNKQYHFCSIMRVCVWLQKNLFVDARSYLFAFAYVCSQLLVNVC